MEFVKIKLFVDNILFNKNHSINNLEINVKLVKNNLFNLIMKDLVD